MSHPSPQAQPLIVRLRNWVGDVVLSLPALQHLQQQGYALRLIGKRWAPELLRATGWPVEVLADSGHARQKQLQQQRLYARGIDPGFERRVNMLLFPYSFSSAWEARRAGLRALGFRKEGRSLLLRRSLPLLDNEHELERYWRLATALSGDVDARPPALLQLPLDEQARAEARQHLAAAGVDGAYTVLCPFGGGPIDGHDKHWPAFGDFARQLQRAGHTLVLCPGPDELTTARSGYDGLHVIPGLGLAAYAALIEGARQMVSNDTGPGHIAAAVGTPLLSVLGPTPVAKWRPWGPQVRVLSGWPQWPSVDAALKAFETLPPRG
ncbi:MAG: glycosyltransferase family 9 protein [Rubrivivax sp.]